MHILLSLLTFNAVFCRGDDVLQFPIVHRPRFFRLRSEVPESKSSRRCQCAHQSCAWQLAWGLGAAQRQQLCRLRQLCTCLLVLNSECLHYICSWI